MLCLKALWCRIWCIFTTKEGHSSQTSCTRDVREIGKLQQTVFHLELFAGNNYWDGHFSLSMTSLEGGEPAIYWVKMTQKTPFKCDLMWRCIYCKLAELVCKLSVTQMSSHLYFPVLWMTPRKQKDFAVGSTLGALFAKFKPSKSYQHIGKREGASVERR